MSDTSLRDLPAKWRGRATAGGEWVLVPREATFAMQAAHGMYGHTSGWWNAVLAAAPAPAQHADGWIAVSERLPLRGQGWVIGVRNTIGGPRVGAVIYEDRVIGQMEWLRLRCPENGKPYEFAGCDVTHWQPLPTPPAPNAAGDTPPATQEG